MKAETFEDLLIWQKAKVLTIDIFLLFENNRNFSFKDQISRASVSIMNNIAEGFERRSNKEFKQYLYYSKGSTGEVRSMLHLAKDFRYVSEEKYKDLVNISIEISKMISSLISKI